MAPFWKPSSKDEGTTISSSSSAAEAQNRRPTSSSSSSSSSSSTSSASTAKKINTRPQQRQQQQTSNPPSGATPTLSSVENPPSRRSSNLSVSFNDTVSYSSSPRRHGGSEAHDDADNDIPGVAEMERRWSAVRQTSLSEREAARDYHSSSADETTGILRADRNGIGQRAYNTNGTTNTAGYGSRASSVRSRRRADSANRADTVAATAAASGDAGLGLDAEVTEKEGWWKRLAEKYGSVELENKGSVARDHLALERTFLAWLRTSLSFASIGIAVTQLFRLNTSISNGHSDDQHERLRHVGKPLGATFIAISIVILLIGFHRYFESQHYVIRGKFPASRGSIVLVSAVAGALIVSSLVVVLVVAPKAFERR